MANVETGKLITERKLQKSVYCSYVKKKEYFDAISAGDISRVFDLSDKNASYTSELFENSKAYSDAMYQMYYESICAASEMCLVAIQNGLPDLSAYDIRDEYMAEFDHAQSLPDLYDLVHGMAYKFAFRVNTFRNESHSSPKLTLMMAYIGEHLRDKITLQDVADAAELSRNYASTLFKQEMGMTMNEFIMQERIREARRLLEAGHLSVSEIADQLQFCSQSYFTQCFGRLTGTTPQNYRTNV